MGYLNVNDSTGKGLLKVFLKRTEKLGLNLSDCFSHCYDNGANKKGKEAGLQAIDICKLIQKLCMLRVQMISHLIVIDSEKSSTEALLFFGV